MNDIYAYACLYSININYIHKHLFNVLCEGSKCDDFTRTNPTFTSRVKCLAEQRGVYLRYYICVSVSACISLFAYSSCSVLHITLFIGVKE